MSTELLIVGLGGSLARVSRSRAALQVALEGAANAGAETALLDLRELALPMYDPDDEGADAGGLAADGAMRPGRRHALEQPDVSGDDLGVVQERARLAARVEQPRAAVPSRQGGRPDQRGRRHPGPAGDQHDGVLEPALRAWAVPYVVPVGAAYRVFDSDGTIKDGAIELQLRTLVPRSCASRSDSPRIRQSITWQSARRPQSASRPSRTVERASGRRGTIATRSRA